MDYENVNLYQKYHQTLLRRLYGVLRMSCGLRQASPCAILVFALLRGESVFCFQMVFVFLRSMLLLLTSHYCCGFAFVYESGECIWCNIVRFLAFSRFLSQILGGIFFFHLHRILRKNTSPRVWVRHRAHARERSKTYCTRCILIHKGEPTTLVEGLAIIACFSEIQSSESINAFPHEVVRISEVHREKLAAIHNSFEGHHKAEAM